ncbi:MAG: glycosyltransferase family 9 protein [Planctomycetota bacterium]|nr:glycosyltransferase family 9 protein [Planctomycetota bacterium]
MTRILIIKTGALGDVLRTTSILNGLTARFEDLHITWLTAHGARRLVESNGRIQRVIGVDPKDAEAIGLLSDELGQQGFDWVLSLDDEEPFCRLASAQASVRLSGAFINEAGERDYTADVAPWFDMGLLSHLGKEAADRLKVSNEESHPAIFARMFAVDMGQPDLALTKDEVAGAKAFYQSNGLDDGKPVIGLNTGAGGRWTSKTMDLAEVVNCMQDLHRALAGQCHFLILGGVAEAVRNQEILLRATSLGQDVHVVDGGDNNTLGAFAALVDRLQLLISSDSLAMHMAVARCRPVVAFFAPTSAAEIELYGLGEKVISTSPDYCSYQKDADNSSITGKRVAEAALRALGQESVT